MSSVAQKHALRAMKEYEIASLLCSLVKQTEFSAWTCERVSAHNACTKWVWLCGMECYT